MRLYRLFVLGGVLLSALVACRPILEVGVEPAVSPSAGLTPRPESPTSAPTAAGLSQQEGDAGLIYLRDGTVYRLAKEGEQPVGAIPPDAGHLALSPGYLAYVHGATIGVLDLPTGATRDLVNVGQRSGQDLALGWLADGATLAYAVAWREPDGSRFVELSITDGSWQTRLDTVVAHPPGPTPTPPASAPIPPRTGFANLAILGGGRDAGYLVVAPAGGTQRYSAIWIYDLLRIGKRARELSLPQAEHIVSLAPSPDLAWLAVSYAHPEAGLGSLVIYPFLGEEASGEGPSAEAPRPVAELQGTHLTDLRWSSDARRLAYIRREGMPALDVSPVTHLEAFHLETGTTSSVPLSAGAECAILGWTADDLAVALSVMDPISARHGVQLVAPDSGSIIYKLAVPGGTRVLGWVGRLPAE
ncbi:MAG: hypothetical protein PHY79_18720 [Anaerolineae bacterium]|nr:hypothetical protein [Anaerolineae bacterium]MDX9830577.1 hypothetical protein [Anaerolineae bacterium]